MGSTDLALSWKDHHGVLFNVFEHLLAKKSLVDCTLAAEGKFLKAHRIVLSACSPYFEALLDQEYDKHPIIFLRDVQFEDLKTLLEFVYSGEIKIPESRLVEFLNVAEALQIKGLGGVGNDGQESSKKTPADAPRKRETSSPVPRKRSRRHSNSSDSNSRDRAEIIPINPETSRLQSSGESKVPVASSSSVPQPAPPAKQTVPSEEISVDVSKVKEEVDHPSQSTCSEQVSSDPDQGEANEEILGLKPEFAQVTFTEDYSDDMMPEDSDSVEPVMDQDQPSSSRQYSGFPSEPVNPGELGIHGSYGVGGADQPVPEGCRGAAALRLQPRCRDFTSRPRSQDVFLADLEHTPSGDSDDSTTNYSEQGIRVARNVFRKWEEINSLKISFSGVGSYGETREGVARRHDIGEGMAGDAGGSAIRSSDPPDEMSRTAGEHDDGVARIFVGAPRDAASASEGGAFDCAKCQRGFPSHQALQRHMLLHSGDKPYACRFCPLTFRHSGNLRKHLVIHTGERPYQCTECGQRFTQSNALNYHVRAKHTGERPFNCPHCDRRFIRSTALKQHLQVHLRRPWTVR